MNALFRSAMGILMCTAVACSIIIAQEGRWKGGKGQYGYRGRGGQKYGQGRGYGQGRRQGQGHGFHRWKGYKGKKSEWKTSWHGGHGFNNHDTHEYNGYVWYWNEDDHVWYQCTPTEDPKQGYGCAYGNKWYSVKKTQAPIQQPEEDIVAEEENKPLLGGELEGAEYTIGETGEISGKPEEQEE